LLYASNDLSKAKAMFSALKARRPRLRYALRRHLRVLERWPPNCAAFFFAMRPR
jgi:hypothetical protein